MKKQKYRMGWALVLTIAMSLTTLFGGFGFIGINGVVEEVYADTGSAPSGNYVDGDSNKYYDFYANGTPITIEEAIPDGAIHGTVPGYVEPTGHISAYIVWSIGETTYYVGAGSYWNDGKYCYCRVFGGSNSDLSASTSITMNGGSIFQLSGGNYSGTLTGNTSIIIKGGTINTINGGGESTIIGDSTVTVENGTITATVYGGNGESSTSIANTTVNIEGGSVATVYGGGGNGTVAANATINVSGGSLGYIVGGGLNDAVLGDVTVNITGGTITSKHYDSQHSIAKGKLGPASNFMLYVSGGSIKEGLYITPLVSATNNTTVEKYSFTVDTIGNNQAVSKLVTLVPTLGYNYGMNDVKTDSSSNIYVYLPSGATQAAVKASSTYYKGTIAANAATLASYTPAVVTATAGSELASTTGTAIVNLSNSITGLSADDISVSEDGVELTSGTDYTVNDISTTSPSITFTNSAGLIYSSVITIFMEKMDYDISGVPLTIVNNIPMIAPTITTASLSNGTVGTAYSETLTATGDVPMSWSIASGSLPTGLILSTGGVISGTPTTAEVANVTVRATNATGNDTEALSITVNAPTYAVSATTNAVVSNGVTATATFGATPYIEGASATVTIALTGTATTTGTHTIGLTSSADVASITAPGTVAKAVTVGDTPIDTYLFTFIMPANAVDDLVVTHTFFQAQSTAPTASTTTVTKTATTQATINFTLDSAIAGTWKVYDAAAGGDIVSGVAASASGTSLTLAHASNVPTGTYYVSVTEAGKTESMRLALTVGAYVAPVTVPGAPTIGTATAGDTQASVSFTAPASNGGAAITGYTVTSNPGGLTATGASSPLTITGLTNGVSYTFTVTATNSAGTGVASAASNSITPASLQTITFPNPGAQNFGTTPTLTATADSGLSVTFTSSTPSVATITSGGLLTFISAGSATINANQAGNSSYLAAPEVSRTFTVNAVNPGAPTIGTATAGDTQASVSFTAPASNGGAAITGYTVTSNPGGLTATGASSPLTITGLTNGVSYTFTVTATNSAGTGAASSTSNSITPAIPSEGGGSGGSSVTTIINTNSGSVTGNQLSKAADVAKDGGTVTIRSYQTGEVNFPTSGLDSLIRKDNSLTIVTEKGTLTFDGKAVNAMGAQASGEEIKVTVEEVDQTKLTKEQQDKVGDKTVYELTVTSGGKLISSFSGGKVTVSIPYVLKAEETADNIIVWYLVDDGSLKEIACVYDEKTNSVTFVVDHFSKYIIGYDDLAGWANPFTDVKSSAWYYNAVAFVNNNGLMNGQTSTLFAPEAPMTRGMFVAILGRMEDVDIAMYANQTTFSDVKNNQYYAPYIAWASDKGIVTGMGAGKFAPDAEITREQMAVMMTNYMKYKGQGPVGAWAIQLTYGDLDKVSTWADEGVMFMTMKDLMNGMGNDTKGNPLFAPKSTSTRAQTAQVMMNLEELLK